MTPLHYAALPLSILLVALRVVIAYAMLAGIALVGLWGFWNILALFVSEDDAAAIISAGLIVMAVMAFVLF